MIVADASCILAIAFGESGMDKAWSLTKGALVSSVNITESVAKLSDRGWDRIMINEFIDSLDTVVKAHEPEIAFEAGILHSKLRRKGVSLGDCCCLALARLSRAKIATGDRNWASLGLDLEVELIR